MVLQSSALLTKSTRKAPAFPLPGELSVLDSISTLHFRKSAVPSVDNSAPKIFPDNVSSGRGLPATELLGVDSLATQDFLSGSKAYTKHYFKG